MSIDVPASDTQPSPFADMTRAEMAEYLNLAIQPVAVPMLGEDMATLVGYTAACLRNMGGKQEEKTLMATLNSIAKQESWKDTTLRPYAMLESSQRRRVKFVSEALLRAFEGDFENTIRGFSIAEYGDAQTAIRLLAFIRAEATNHWPPEN